MDSYDVVTLGGGIAGLVVAHETVAAGGSVAVFERQPYIGGLARTVEHGPYRFDQGGHRFHTDDERLKAWIDDLMGDRILHVVRKSRIRIRGTWVSYPLAPAEAVTAFGLTEAATMSLSYLRAALARNGKAPRHFRDWVTRRFGRRLFDIYFGPYTEKVWGVPSEEVSADWAAERISSGNLLKTLVQSVRKGKKTAKSLISKFRYFRRGIGELSERLGAGVAASGRSAVHLATSVTGLERDGESWIISARGPDGDLRVRANHVVSTVPITLLPRLLPEGPERDEAMAAAAGLRYRGVICVMAGVRRPRLSDDTWVYFPEKSMLFGRLHEPKNWSPEMVPEGRTSFCLEIFASPGDANWVREDDDLVGTCARHIEDLGWLRRDEVEWPRVVRVPGAYPVWSVGYAEPLRRLRGAIADLGNIHPVGRTGNFEYLNIDGVVLRAWELTDTLLGRGDVRVSPDSVVVT